jgi:Putative peptidoglycan binding domain
MILTARVAEDCIPEYRLLEVLPMFAVSDRGGEGGARARLRDRVGNGSVNHLEDVIWVKAALHLLGRLNEKERHGYITRALDNAIRAYQRDRGLRRDGYLNPGGETECTLCVELARLAGRARP